jgi:hypothetical protein
VKTVEELKARATSRYEGVLKRLLLGEDPFPLHIPYKRPKRTGDPSHILKTKALLRSQSKEVLGFGPVIQFEQGNTRKFGEGALPGDIVFTGLQDLVCYIGKRTEAERILQNAKLVTDAFPQLNQWTATRLRLLSSRDASMWRAIITVVQYFSQHPKPWLYARELPLALPTKFLERNYGPVIGLLSEVSPSALNEPYSTWQDRLGLRSSSDLIEGRFLDSSLEPQLPRHMIVPIKEWNRCCSSIPAWILITENRTTLLTLPELPGCLALLGKGYAVTRLAELENLHKTEIQYWGDIDQHGFEILASIRSHLKQTVSCLMDDTTLLKCEKQIGKEDVKATLSEKFVAEHLTEQERLLWRRCGQQHLRLEQEHIPSNIAHPILRTMCSQLNILKRANCHAPDSCVDNG